MSQLLPDNWPVPKWDAKAPQPCTKPMLCAWLAAHHEFDFTDPLPGMPTIVRAVEYRYRPAAVPNTGGGDVPATWDVWAFVVTQERRIRGGQRSLLEGMGI